MDHKSFKILSAFGVSVFLDHYLIGETNWYNNSLYGVALGTAMFSSEFVMAGIDSLPVHIPTISKSLYDGKTLTSRIVEISIMTGTSTLINSKGFNNTKMQGTDELVFRVGMSAAIDIMSEYFADYMSNQKLESLTDDQ